MDLNRKFFEGIDAVVVLTEWEIYSKINWIEAAQCMRSPGWVFDTRSIVDSQKVLEASLNLWRVGDGVLNEQRKRI